MLFVLCVFAHCVWSKLERDITIFKIIFPILTSGVAKLPCAFFVPPSPPLAVDRSVTASLNDAWDALVNVLIDSLAAYRSSVLSNQQPGLMVPLSLQLFPLFVLALLKQVRKQNQKTAW
jgi:hypothetical protein